MTITTEFWFHRNNGEHIGDPIKDIIATMQLAYASNITDATQTYRIAKNYDTEKVQKLLMN